PHIEVRSCRYGPWRVTPGKVGMLMTPAVRRALRWLLCSAAFSAVIAASGCSSRAPMQSAPAKTQAAAPVLFDNSDDPASKPPVVNIFGELDGAAPKLNRPA